MTPEKAAAGRKRGRPKKDLTPSPAKAADFETFAAAIRGCPEGRPRAVTRQASIEAALADTRLCRTAIAVYLLLLAEDIWRCGVALVAMGTIARKLCIARKNVARAIKRLVRLGYLLRES